MDSLVKRLADALTRLADAADEVGVKHFDDDSLSSEVVAMQGATLDARALLAEFDASLAEPSPAQASAKPEAPMYVMTPAEQNALHRALRSSGKVVAPPAAPEGMVLVPREPTAEMIQAAGSAWVDQRNVYRAMLAAAPTPGETPPK